MTNPTTAQEELDARMDLGAKVAIFLESPVGAFLLERAVAEEREALEALATVNAFEPDAIRLLQAQAWRANSFVGWLQQAMHDAMAAKGEQDESERLPE